MHLILASREDPASMSMARYLLDKVEFNPPEDSDGLYTHGDYVFSYIGEKHLYLKDFNSIVDGNASRVEDVIFLSKHSSRADIKSLTVHPTGNFSDAMLGGEPEHLSMSDPAKMSSALRAMSDSYNGTEFSVTFEATHHGPLLEVPNFFIEIGTTEKQWEDREALETVISAIFSESTAGKSSFVGAGGGHYMPKVTKYALENGVDVGHMISKHALESISEEMIMQSVMKTPGCRGFIIDRKGVKSAPRQKLKDIAEREGLEIITV